MFNVQEQEELDHQANAPYDRFDGMRMDWQIEHEAVLAHDRHIDNLINAHEFPKNRIADYELERRKGGVA